MRVQKSDTFKRRSAERIARAIELDIIGRDLPVGTMIGSEAELMERYEASRGVIREAVALVESHMLAETRRGVGGGLIVAEPEPSVVAGILSLYLARHHATESELLETRLALETLALRKAVERLDAEGAEMLRAEMERALDPDEDLVIASQEFHFLLAELSGDTVLQLVIPALAAVVGEMWEMPRSPITKRQRNRFWKSVVSHHRAIIEPMLVGDVETAVDRLQGHLETVIEALPVDRRVQVSAH